MAVRDFAGVGGTPHQITLDEGTLDSVLNGGWTFAAILKLDSGTAATQTIIGLQALTVHRGGVWITSGDALQGVTDGQARTFGITVPEDAWVLVAINKASGSATMRGHIYNLTTPAGWTHADTADGTLGNDANTITEAMLGSSPGDWFFQGRLAIAAVWASSLADATLEGLTAAASAWLSSSPAAMWRLNQTSTATDVTDDTGNGATQTALAGTTVVTGDDPPGFNFSLGFSGPLNTVTETDTAVAFGRQKSRALGVALAADTAQAFAKTKRRALGVASEADHALALGGAPVVIELPGVLVAAGGPGSTLTTSGTAPALTTAAAAPATLTVSGRP